MTGNVIIQRKIFNVKPVRNCIGELFINNDFIAYTLEDEVRANNKKIYGKTAIPADKYDIKLIFSPKFKKTLPIIYNDPVTLKIKSGDVEWSGILIHGGNTDEDTLGCILVGKNTDRVKIWNNCIDEIIKTLKVYDNIGIEIQNKIFSKGLNQKIE